MSNKMQSSWLDEAGLRRDQTQRPLPKWLEGDNEIAQTNKDLVRRLRQSEDWRQEADDWAHDEFRKWLQGNSRYNDPQLKTNVMRVAHDQMKTPDDEQNPGNQNTPGFNLNQQLNVSATPWADKSLTGVAGVKDYLRSDFKSHMQREFDYGKLYYFGPQDVNEAWHYFKRFCLNDRDDEIANRHFGPPNAGDPDMSLRIHNRYPGDVPLRATSDRYSGTMSGPPPPGAAPARKDEDLDVKQEVKTPLTPGKAPTPSTSGVAQAATPQPTPNSTLATSVTPLSQLPYIPFEESNTVQTPARLEQRPRQTPQTRTPLPTPANAEPILMSPPYVDTRQAQNASESSSPLDVAINAVRNVVAEAQRLGNAIPSQTFSRIRREVDTRFILPTATSTPAGGNNTRAQLERRRIDERRQTVDNIQLSF